MNHDINNNTTSESGWHEASKAEPCPLCGKPDWCFISSDGDAVLCRRISNTPNGWKHKRDASDGIGAIYVRINRTGYVPRVSRAKKPAKKKQEFPIIAIENVEFSDISFTDTWSINSPEKVSDDEVAITYNYDSNHKVIRTERKDSNDPKGYKKKCLPYVRESIKHKWVCGKGESAWIPYGLEAFRKYREWIDDDDDSDNQKSDKLPYKIVNLLINKWVIGVEGEKCVDAVINNLQLATFTVQGGSWDEKSLNFAMDYLNENHVAGIIYIPDNDLAGNKKAESMAESAARSGLRFLQLDIKRMWPNCPEKGDIADWIATKPSRIGEDNYDWGITETARNEIYTAIETEIKLALREHKRQQKIQNLTSTIAIAAETVRDRWGERLRYNKLKNVIELDGNPIDLNRVKLDIGYEFDINVSVQDACMIVEALAKENSYSPVVEYLNQVSKTHQNIDTTIIDNLASRYFGTDNPLHNAYLKRTLIAAVARAMEPGCKHDYACILVGTQGYFKSTFWRELFGADWFTDEVGDCSDKDELMKLHRVWAAEIAEFEVVYRRKDISQLKRFMSSPVDDYRPPYGRQVEHFPRASVLVGTSNERQILNDPTGNRRFWIVPVTKRIDIDSIKKERDLLWAIAVKLYTQGEQWWLTDTEDSLQVIDNQNYTTSDPWEELILGHIENLSSVTTTELLLSCLKLDSSRMDTASQRRVAQILQKNGWEPARTRIDGKKIRHWVRVSGPDGPDGGPHVQMYPAQPVNHANQDFPDTGPDGPDKTSKKPPESENLQQYKCTNPENTSFSLYRNLSGPSGPSGPPSQNQPPTGTFKAGDEVRYVGGESRRASGKKLVVTITNEHGIWVRKPDGFPDGPFAATDLQYWE